MTTDSPETTAEVGVDVQRLVRHVDAFRRTAAEQRQTARMQQERYGTGNSIYCEAVAIAAALEEVCACIESCLPND